MELLYFWYQVEAECVKGQTGWYQQKAILRQMLWSCVQSLLVWTLGRIGPVGPVGPVVMRHILLRLVCLETFPSTGFHPNTCH